MDIALLFIRLILAGVFLVAGAAKLIDRTGSSQAIIDFGLPVRFAPLLGTGVPLLECVIGAALLLTATAQFAAFVAIGVLFSFIIGIVVNLLKGRRPDCHCFGQLHSAPIGPAILVRNSLLLALALVIVTFGPGLSPVQTIIAYPVTVLVIILILLFSSALAVQSWFIWQLIHQQGHLLLRLETLERASGVEAPSTNVLKYHTEGLTVDTKAPRFTTISTDNELVSLDALMSTGLPIVLIFTDPNCGPCNALLPDIAKWQRDLATRVIIAVVSRGSYEINRGKAVQYSLTNVLIQEEDVFSLYDVNGTPGAVLVSPQGMIGSPLAMGRDAIEALVQSINTPGATSASVQAVTT